jgi:hypothetical protein
MMPYKETRLGNNQYIREFKSDVNNDELEWHLDKEDRIVETIQNEGWMIQIDNQLPIILKDEVYIPKETYHRLIKGNNTLIVKINKLIED